MQRWGRLRRGRVLFRKPLHGCFRVGNKTKLRGVVDDFSEKWLSRWKRQT